MAYALDAAVSFSGRTPDFEFGNVGSTPAAATNLEKDIRRELSGRIEAMLAAHGISLYEFEDWLKGV